MNTPKLSIIGMITGASVLAASVIRWFFMYYDPSQLILGIIAGATICTFSYIYHWMKSQDTEMRKINKRLDAFTDWWAKQEMK